MHVKIFVNNKKPIFFLGSRTLKQTKQSKPWADFCNAHKMFVKMPERRKKSTRTKIAKRNGNGKRRSGRKKKGGGKKMENVLTRRVRERVHFWARPTMEKGSQCVGMKEWRSDTVAIPPIVDRSSALKPSILSKLPLRNLTTRSEQFAEFFFLRNFADLHHTLRLCCLRFFFFFFPSLVV